MRKYRGYILKALAVIVTAVLLTVPVSAHGGRTDSQGGHNSPSGYHYHHGYPAHQHEGGLCPYKTGQVGTSEKSGSNDTIAAQENILNDEDSLRAEVLACNKELVKQIKYKYYFAIAAIILAGVIIILSFHLRTREKSIEALEEARRKTLCSNFDLEEKLRQTQEDLSELESRFFVTEDIMRRKLCTAETDASKARLRFKIAERTILSLRERLAEAEQKNVLPPHTDGEADGDHQ